MILFICGRSGRGHILALCFLSVCFFLAATTPVQAIQKPESCRIGAYLVDLYRLDPNNKSFNADIWLWSNCAKNELQPLKRVEYKNANSVNNDYYNIIQEKNIYWEHLKVKGNFRQDWDVRDYPFDHHTLEIIVEESTSDIRKFVYVPDSVDSHYDTNIHLEDWNIESFKMIGTKDVYSTTFGDPTLRPGDGSVYSQIRIQIVVARSDFSSFFKLMAPAYVSFILTIITFFLALDSALSLGLLAGVLFVVVVSIRDVSDTLGSASGLTLPDQLHIVILLYIMEAVIIAIISRKMQEHGKAREKINRLNMHCFWIDTLSFIVINIALVAWAIYSG